MTDTTPSVSLVFSTTSLLSGDLDGCYDVDDTSCEGGIALVRALLRQYSDGVDEANLIINRLDYQSVFVQMHPLGWNVNRLILHDYFGMETFWTKASLMGQHTYDSPKSMRDLSGLQTFFFRPTVHANYMVPTTNSWSQYVKHVHFDDATGLAICYVQEQIISTGGIESLSPEEASRALMHYIAQENRASGCSEGLTPYDEYILEKNRTNIDQVSNRKKCWIPVLIKESESGFQSFLEAIQGFEHTPAVLVNIKWHDEAYSQPRQVGKNKMWVVSYEDDDAIARQLRVSLTDDRKRVSNISILEHELGSFPNSTKDDELRRDVDFLRELANEAQLDDPVQGLSAAMPVARVDDFRACFGGECPIGNLFMDALRWFTGADFAFHESGGTRGEGWPAGPVRVSDLWAALPFANTECTGTISGVTIFRLFELATREAGFVSSDVENGDRLFQVSGLRYTYNTQLLAPRLVKLEIIDKETQEYVPVERLKLYNYTTSSWMCGGFDPFPSILSDELQIQGETPSIIGDNILQNIVGDYLHQVHSHKPYDTSIQGRLVNDTSATARLNFIQGEESCTSSSYWVEEAQSCIDCPTMENVILAGSEPEFSGISGVHETFFGSANVVNGETFPVQIAFKSIPEWATITTTTVFGLDGKAMLITVEPGQSFALEYSVTAEDLAPGVATGTLSFAVVDGGNYPGCVGRDLVLPLSQTVSNTPQFASEGSIRIVGFIMVTIISCTSMAFALWVYVKREKSSVKMMQPTFLLAICFGVFIIGLSILCRSLVDSDELSEKGHDIACMTNAWLLSMGFSLVISALLAKLWRINQVADGALAFRRTNVTVRSAVMHFSVQFVLNFILMLVWTLVDPMNYTIRVVEGEEWKLYGTCGNMGTAGWTFLWLTVGINFCILLLAVYEAYKARKLGEEYSESSGLGLALFCWLQLVLVVAPVLFLIDKDSAGPRYFLSVSLVFACCMSMLLFIFVPLVMKVRQQSKPSRCSFGNFASNRASSHFTVEAPFAKPSKDSNVGVGLHGNISSYEIPPTNGTEPVKEESQHDSSGNDGSPIHDLECSDFDDPPIQEVERPLPVRNQPGCGHKRVDFCGTI